MRKINSITPNYNRIIPSWVSSGLQVKGTTPEIGSSVRASHEQHHVKAEFWKIKSVGLKFLACMLG